VSPILKTLAASLAASLYPFSGGIAVAAESLNEDDSGMEIVVVTGVRRQHEVVLQTQQVSYTGPDNSDLLRLFPGGNRNSNGPLTRISQYRGLFGAQNQVAIDGFGYTPDCPNWMDSPLSSIPQSMTESVTLYRGIGSVDAVEEGLGGAIRIESRSGEFSESDDWSSYGSAEANYGSNASSWGAALFAGVNNAHNWLDLSASKDTGDAYEFDGGFVSDSQYDREQYRLGYGHRFDEAEISFGAVINRTGETATSATTSRACHPPISPPTCSAS
jgi:iron complex outermembrane receptor protein